MGLLRRAPRKDASYALGASLGRGSFGEVFRAHVLRPVAAHEARHGAVLPPGKTVAVKIIQVKAGVWRAGRGWPTRPRQASLRKYYFGATRLEREGRILLEFDHRNVVLLYDIFWGSGKKASCGAPGSRRPPAPPLTPRTHAPAAHTHSCGWSRSSAPWTWRSIWPRTRS
jgi:hypothetical protein